MFLRARRMRSRKGLRRRASGPAALTASNSLPPTPPARSGCTDSARDSRARWVPAPTARDPATHRARGEVARGGGEAADAFQASARIHRSTGLRFAGSAGRAGSSVRNVSAPVTRQDPTTDVASGETHEPQTDLITTAALALAVLHGLASGAQAAKASGGGNSTAAKLCQKGGWQGLVTSSGQPLRGQGACVAYAAKGGTLSARPTSSLVFDLGTCTPGSGEFLICPTRSLVGFGLMPGADIVFCELEPGQDDVCHGGYMRSSKTARFLTASPRFASIA